MKHKLLCAVSVLPALLVMPAVADDSVVLLTYPGSMISYTGSELVAGESGSTATLIKNTLTEDGKIEIDVSGFITPNGKTGYGAFTNMYRDSSAPGTDKVAAGSVNLINSRFEGNKSNNAGGAVTLWHDGGADTTVYENTIASTSFVRNSATESGGALSLMPQMDFVVMGKTTVADTMFEENSSKKGGAIYNEHDKLIIKNGAFLNNYASWAGGAIYAKAATSLTIDSSSFEGNYTSYNDNANTGGGAIYNAAVAKISNSTFKGNKSSLDSRDGDETTVTQGGAGGAIANIGNLTLENVGFEGNRSSLFVAHGGGAISNASGAEMSVKGGSFSGNYTPMSSGGAILNSGTITLIDGTEFAGNYALNGQGGAISNGVDGKITKIVNATFSSNYSKIGNSDAESTGGGSIFNSGLISEIIDTTFISNGLQIAEDGTENLIFGRGGAIHNKNGSIVDIKGSTFIGNKSIGNGGAIFNQGNGLADSQDKGKITISSSDNNDTLFKQNHSNASGGALSGLFDVTGAEFKLNTAGVQAGAWGVANGSTVTDSVFANNHSEAGGGATVNSNNVAFTVDNVKFIENTVGDTYTKANGVADWHRGGGANYSTGMLTVTNSVYDGNIAGGFGGAISVWRNNESTYLSVTDTEFKNNISKYGWGGAIANTAKITQIVKGTESAENAKDASFTENTAVLGGAIANMARKDLSSVTTEISEISGYVFASNHAVANDVALIRDEEGKFENASDELRGHLDGMGGAIYNEGKIAKIQDVTFENNTATDFGGAIYNSAKVVTVKGGEQTLAAVPEITFSGTNMFSGNTANGVGNDIYNAGAITIAGGTTTLNSGLVNAGTFTNNDGATLKLGGDVDLQSALTNNGTLTFLAGSMLQGVDFNGSTWVEGNGNITGSTTLILENGFAGGEFKLLGDTAGFAFTENALYNITGDADGLWTVAKKSAAETATALASAGVEANEAVALNAIASVATTGNQKVDEVFATIATAVQTGDVESAKKAVKLINPEAKPVVASVSKSVQGQLLTQTANRMGRSGGDVALTGGGVWAQGSFNKSKMNEEFHGYTRAVTAGIDEVINHDVTLGLGYSFANTDVHANNGRSTDIDSNTLFLYAQYKPNQWYINGTAHYTTSKYKENADVLGIEKTAKYNVDAFGANVATGYRFASGATPELGLRYLNVSQDEYVDSFGMKISADTVQYLTSVAGVKYQFDIFATDNLVLRPELRAAATYDIVSDKANATVVMPGGVAGYTLKGDRLSRTGGEFGVGLTANWCGVELSVGYDLNIHKDYTSQTGMVKARWEF